MWFDACSAPCVKKRACDLVYPIFLVCQNAWFGRLGVCSAEGEWAERGVEDREVHDSDKVKEVSGLGKPSMWHITLLISKGGSPWKGEIAWDRAAYML